MTAHTWETEEIDGGAVGADDFWICRKCGASGGPVFSQPERLPRYPFLAGPALPLSTDCGEAAAQIKTYRSRT